MKRIIKSLPLSIALAALASMAAAGCAAIASATPAKSASVARAGFAGYKWRVVAIDRAGKETAIPAFRASAIVGPDGTQAVSLSR